MRHIFYLLTLFQILAMASCSKKAVPPQVIRVVEAPKNFYSEIIINYKLDKTGIKDTFNRAIAQSFKDPFIIPDYDIKLTLSKPKDAIVEIEGKQVLVVIPVAIAVEKKTLLADLKAKGLLEMNFTSDIHLDSLWGFTSKTSLIKHKWLEQPKLSIGGVSIPIETISNAVIKKTKADLQTTIDQSLKESFTIRQSMIETMRMFDAPFQIDPSVNAFLQIKPEKVFLNKVKNTKFIASGKLALRTANSFTSYKPSNVTKVGLPKLYWSETIPDSTTFRVVVDMKVSDLNQILKSNLDGRTFDADGGKSITLTNTIMSTDYDLLTVETDVKGSINGKLVIKGRPKYDANKNEFYVEIRDIGLKSKNVAIKTVAWLAEGKIRKEIEGKLHFPLNTYLAEAQQNINTQISTLNKTYDLEMIVKLGNIDVESFELNPGQIQSLLRSKLYIEMGIKDFRSFSKFK